MKLPNGFGSVYKLSGNRRRPWIARKTIGWSDEGKQLYYTVGYFKTRREALEALIEYNKNPIEKRRDITLEKLYKEWSKGRYPELRPKTVKTYEFAWNHLSELGDMLVRDIKTPHIQKVINDMNEKKLSRSACQKVKTLAGILIKYAMADDIIDKNYAQMVVLPEKKKKKRERFTREEIAKIERLAEKDPIASVVLILIYTGMRIGEIVSITKEDVDLDNMFIVGGIKSDAGKDRIIPIHPKIQEHIKYWHKTNGKYLIPRHEHGGKMRTEYFRNNLYYPSLKKAGVRRLTPHTCRHTFASMAAESGMDPLFIQRIIGHADYSTTANIYTHPETNELKKAMERI